MARKCVLLPHSPVVSVVAGGNEVLPNDFLANPMRGPIEPFRQLGTRKTSSGLLRSGPPPQQCRPLVLASSSRTELPSFDQTQLRPFIAADYAGITRTLDAIMLRVYERAGEIHRPLGR